MKIFKIAYFDSSEARKANIFIFIAAVLALFSTYFFVTLDFPYRFWPGLGTTSLWLFSLFLLLIAASIYDHRKEKVKFETDSQIAKKNISYGLVCFVVYWIAVGFYLRIWQIQQFGLSLDEYYWLSVTENIYNGYIFSPFGFIGDQPSNLQAFLILPFYAVLDEPLLIVRLPQVLYSLGTGIFIFLTLRKFYSLHSALCFVPLFALSIWDIHASHMGFHNIGQVAFSISVVIYFALKAFYGGRAAALRCGIVTALCFNTMYVSPMVILVVAFGYLRKIVQASPDIFARSLLFTISFILVSYPTIIKIIKYPFAATGQIRKFGGHNLEEGIMNPFYYLQQIVLLFNDIIYAPSSIDKVRGFQSVTLNTFELYCFALGLLVLLFQIKKKENATIVVGLAVFASVMIFLFRFSSLWREYGMLPWIFIIISILPDSIMQWLKLSRSNHNMLTIWTLLVTWTAYFSHQTYWKARQIYAPQTVEASLHAIANNFKSEDRIPDEIIVGSGLEADLLKMQLFSSQAKVIAYVNTNRINDLVKNSIGRVSLILIPEKLSIEERKQLQIQEQKLIAAGAQISAQGATWKILDITKELK